jgi:fluoroacetyl-CoA thioesterase
MNSEAWLGAIGMASLTIRPGDTFVALSVSELPIVSTSALINISESACSAALEEFFAPGQTSTTTQLSLTYISGVGVGNEIRAHATCVAAAENLLTFITEIHHENRLIASIRIQRRLVDRVSFMARTAAEGILADTMTTKKAP